MKSIVHNSILTLLVCFAFFSGLAAQPVAGFTADVTSGCKTLTVQFTDQSAGTPDTWFWDFGNGDTSVLQNPVVTYTSPGSYPVLLRVTSPSGTDDELKQGFITVYPGTDVQFSARPITGCIPLDVSFNNQSVITGGASTSFSWDFGDGNVSSIPDPAHQYIDTGQFTVKLSATNSFGCSDSLVVVNYIKPGTKPIASFYADPTNACAADPIIFTNTTQGNVTSWMWIFDDGDTSTRKNPAHFYQDTGYQTVTLIATYNGCSDTSVVPRYVFIKPPIVKIRTQVECATPYTRYFQAKFLGEIRYKWFFGDGTEDSVNKFPVHVYNNPGSYVVRLKAWGPECTFTDSLQLFIVDEKPTYSFTASRSNICRFDTVTFTASNYDPAYISAFSWNFGDGSPQTAFSTKNSESHIYRSKGTYFPFMVTLDINGCYDTIRPGISVVIYGPTANFSTSPVTCINNPAKFTDRSVPDGTFAITNWTWDYGDGTVQTYTAPPFSHLYNSIGSYHIKLNVIDANGCIDSLIQSNAITTVPKPVANFSVNDSIVCLQESIDFTDQSQGQLLGRTWYFGDGDTSSQANPAHTYKQPGTYTTQLIIGSTQGCTDTTEMVLTTLPLPTVDAGTDSTICQGQPIVLQATGASTYAWNSDPALSCTDCAAPIASPMGTSTFFVTGTDTAGCSETDSLIVKVKQPFTITLNTSVDSICVGSSVQLTASGAERYSWQPSTGLNSSSISNPVATPAASTVYTVIGSDDRNCFTDTATTSINVGPFPQFNIIDSNVTVAAGASFLIKTANSPDIINWQWSPATDLSCTNCPQPYAKANKIIKYSAVATNAYGCSVSDVITIKGLCNKDVIFIPNTFSPNGDNVNDRFYPRGNGLYMVKSMRIFNRLGQIVFQKLNFPADVASEGWDGKYYGKAAPQDVYVYIIEIICNNGIIVTFKGDITLL